MHKYIGRKGCKAFPDGIPQEISRGEFDHRNPYLAPDFRVDNDITFSEDPDASELWPETDGKIPEAFAGKLLALSHAKATQERRASAMERALDSIQERATPPAEPATGEA